MGRVLKDAKLSTRSARLNLAPRPAPYYRLLDPGLHLGYRRLRSGPGTWLTRRRIGKAYVVENLRTRDDGLVLADDYADADGTAVLTFQQAQAASRLIGTPVRGGDKLLTVREAVESYRADIVARGGDITNADRVLLHLPETLGQKIVARLLVRDFRDWTDNLNAAALKAATIDRINSNLRAALNLAATNDERIVERPWRKAIGGKFGRGEETANNVNLSPEEIAGIVHEAYRIDDYFGRFCEVASETGARASQIERLRVRDLDFERRQLLMPTSFKGKRNREVEHRPLLISDGLARRLHDASKGEKSTDALLPRGPDGKPFSTRNCALGDHFAAALKAYDPQLIERDGVKITMYSLRHTSIIRSLLANISVRIVARWHDTSLKYLERNYSRHIDRHADDVRRHVLLNLSPADAGNVRAAAVTMARRRRFFSDKRWRGLLADAAPYEPDDAARAAIEDALAQAQQWGPRPTKAMQEERTRWEDIAKHLDAAIELLRPPHGSAVASFDRSPAQMAKSLLDWRQHAENMISACDFFLKQHGRRSNVPRDCLVWELRRIWIYHFRARTVSFSVRPNGMLTGPAVRFFSTALDKVGMNISGDGLRSAIRRMERDQQLYGVLVSNKD